MSTIQSIASIIDRTAVYFHVDTDDNKSKEEDVGNGRAVSSIGSPLTNVADFLKISTKSLEQWRKRRRENNEDDDNEFDDQFHCLPNILRQQREKQNQASSRKRCHRRITPRSCKRLQPDTISIHSTEEGVDCVRISTSPTCSPWYIHYVAAPQLGHPRFNIQFRFRFRMPYQEFLCLLTAINVLPLFSRWTKSDAVGSPLSPLALLLFVALSYLGRSWTFDEFLKPRWCQQKLSTNFSCLP